MILSVHASYPYAHTYVLKLHHDAAPQHGRLFGRLEHPASGVQCDFASAEELLACIASTQSTQECQS
jgi:hypothetical protein